MSFLLHVKYETTCPKSSEVIIESLKKLVQHQIDNHYGPVVTYHFTRPHPDKDQCYFEFTEIYASTQIYYDHAGASLIDAFTNLFSNDHRKSYSTVAVGDFTKNGLLKSSLVKVINATFPEYKGQVLNAGMVGTLQSKNTKTPIMVKLKLKPKGDINELIKEVEDAFVKKSNSSASVTLLIFAWDGEVHVLQIHSLESTLCTHWQSIDFDFLKNVESSILEVYGDKVEMFQRCIENIPLTTISQVKSEVGYILHPEACMSIKKEEEKKVSKITDYDTWIKEPLTNITGVYDYTISYVPKLKKVPSFEKDYFKQCRYWIETQGINVNQKDKYERTMLSYACESNYLSVAKLLLEKNCVIECRDYEPLCDACHAYNFEMIKMLIEYGADINVKDYQQNTPFHWVLRCGKDDETMMSILNLFKDYKLDLTAKDLDGDTYLHLATRYGHVWMTRELIKMGADCNAKNLKGNTVLLNCCESSWGWNMNVFRVVYQKVGKKGLEAKNDEGNNSLHMAARNGLVTLTRFLCNHVKVNDMNGNGNTPIMEASLNNRNVTVIQYLISFGADLHHKNFAGLTPLQLALINYNLDVVFVIMSRLDRQKMVESIKDLIPNLEQVVDTMVQKKIDLDRIEKDEEKK